MAEEDRGTHPHACRLESASIEDRVKFGSTPRRSGAFSQARHRLRTVQKAVARGRPALGDGSAVYGADRWQLVTVYDGQAIFKRPLAQTHEDHRPHHNVLLSGQDGR